MIKIQFKQAKEAKQELRRLRRESNKMTDAGLKAAAKPAAKDLKGFSSTESLLLRRAVGVKNLNRKDKRRYGLNFKTRAVKIGFIRSIKDAKLFRLQKKITLPALASILSYGSKAHEIIAKHSKNKKLKINNNAFYGEVSHPGTTGSGFLTRAFNKTDSNVEHLFYQGVDEYLTKHGH